MQADHGDGFSGMNPHEKDCSTCGKTLEMFYLRNRRTGTLMRFIPHGGSVIQRNRPSRYKEGIEVPEHWREGPAQSDQIVCTECIAKHVPEPITIWDWMKEAGLELL